MDLLTDVKIQLGSEEIVQRLRHALKVNELAIKIFAKLSGEKRKFAIVEVEADGISAERVSHWVNEINLNENSDEQYTKVNLRACPDHFVLRCTEGKALEVIECNGNFGAMTSADTIDGTLANSSLRKWTADEVNAVVNNGVALWMFNGETDGDNPAAQQDVIKVTKDLYRQAGKNEEWIDLFVRASGLQSWKFKYWGETDHSVTKVVAWNYLDHPYTDVWENQRALRAGDTYTFTGKESTYTHYDKTMDYTYRVYPESVSEWLRKIFDAQK